MLSSYSSPGFIVILSVLLNLSEYSVTHRLKLNCQLSIILSYTLITYYHKLLSQQFGWSVSWFGHELLEPETLSSLKSWNRSSTRCGISQVWYFTGTQRSHIEWMTNVCLLFFLPRKRKEQHVVPFL